MNFLGKKMKRNRIIISLLVLILSLCISACLNQQASAQKIPIKGSATLFFHGGGSSYHAEEHGKVIENTPILRLNPQKDGYVWSKQKRRL